MKIQILTEDLYLLTTYLKWSCS